MWKLVSSACLLNQQQKVLHWEKLHSKINWSVYSLGYHFYADYLLDLSAAAFDTIDHKHSFTASTLVRSIWSSSNLIRILPIPQSNTLLHPLSWFVVNYKVLYWVCSCFYIIYHFIWLSMYRQCSCMLFLSFDSSISNPSLQLVATDSKLSRQSLNKDPWISAYCSHIESIALAVHWEMIHFKICLPVHKVSTTF